jgi:hypothetical protein
MVVHYVIHIFKNALIILITISFIDASPLVAAALTIFTAIIYFKMITFFRKAGNIQAKLFPIFKHKFARVY